MRTSLFGGALVGCLLLAVFRPNSLAPEVSGSGVDNPNREVTFYSNPPHSAVFLRTSTGPYYVGTTEMIIRCNSPRFNVGDRIVFQLHHAGFKDYEFMVPTTTFNRQRRWPSSGALQMDPDYSSTQYWLYEAGHGVPYGIALLVAGLFGRTRWRHRRQREEAQLRRAERLETLQSKVLEKNADRSLEGAVLGSWRLLEPIGSGGMATVYRAVPDHSLDESEPRAVKVVKKEFSADKEFRERFKREFELSSRLVHPAVVQVYDSGEHEGYLYLVMEYVKGRTLRDAMEEQEERAGMSLRAALGYLKPVFQAVQAAHEKNIVHRDLKPENVMVLDNGKVKVMDFGLAKKLQQTVKVTATGALLGTPAYMAPEQVTTNVLDPRSDQYALGIMAYELLAGELPFQDENVTTLLFKRLYEDPPALRSVRPDLPASVEDTIRRMMDREPRNRFASLDEALVCLDPSAATDIAVRQQRTAMVE